MTPQLHPRISAALLAVAASAALADVPVCPASNYATHPNRIAHVNNPGLVVDHGPGPTPAGWVFQTPSGPVVDPTKCGITELRAATPTCPSGQAHWSYDLFDLWSDNSAPLVRVFREELTISSFDGIPVGGRLKFAEVAFFSGDTFSFHYDRQYSWSQDMTVTRKACPEAWCQEEEISRFGLEGSAPQEREPPRTLTISWTTGRQFAVQPEISWSIHKLSPYVPYHLGWAPLSPLNRETTFSHGVVNGSCSGNESTTIRFRKPRFENQ